jgi:hypothetical protein
MSDLSPLAGLTQLATLDIRGCGRKIRARQLSALAGLAQLNIVR